MTHSPFGNHRKAVVGRIVVDDNQGKWSLGLCSYGIERVGDYCAAVEYRHDYRYVGSCAIRGAQG